MHLVCDFDDTVFDNHTAWMAWLEMLERVGVDRSFAVATVQPVIVDGFTPEKHAHAVGLQEGDKRLVIGQFGDYVRKFAPELVFPEVKSFFERNAFDHSFSFLTYGDEGFQKEKIRAAGFDGLVCGVRIASLHAPKVAHLKDLVRESSGVLSFVDDSPNQLIPVVNEGLPVKLYRMIRKNGRHALSPHPFDHAAWQNVSSFEEIELL